MTNRRRLHSSRSASWRSRLGLAAALLCVAGCKAEPGKVEQAGGPPAARTLTLAGYTPIREVYGQALIPAFKKRWKAAKNEDLEFRESYVGSGAQSRAIVAGFEADVACLSLEPDITRLVEKGLVDPAWSKGPLHGMVTRSVVAIAVRPGNPKGIRDWDDLKKPGTVVLTPDPRTSGGAMWNIAAIDGAARRRHRDAPALGLAESDQLLGAIVKNVTIMDKGARESLLTFEQGVGDAAITYENEVLMSKATGRPMDYVVPPSTLLIENPAAVVAAWAKKHKNLELAEEFVRFLATEEAQVIFERYGMRSVIALKEAAARPAVADLFTIADLGGWPAVTADLFAKGARFERLTTEAR